MPVLNRAIASLFAHDINRRIEEVIKVDQTQESVVAAELREYVVTEKIQEEFRKLLDRYLETQQKPHEGVGIWISGFFGSGKSSFAKILGYILQNRRVEGDHASDLFLNRLPGAAADELRVLLRQINEKIPTNAVIFDVSTDRGIKSSSERLTAIMYRAFLRDLGYAQDFTLAELEINLEATGKLPAFEERFQKVYKKPWQEARSLIALAVGQASRVMHDLEPDTYPAPDSWSKALQKTEIDVNPNLFADRVFDLTKRRRGDQTIIFVIDEVGQYVARSTDKMLDLQGVVQALGAKGRGKAWVAVTSQERLDEIVSSLDQTRVELARLRDRFPLRVDLVASDIAEVTSTRVLLKKADVAAELENLHDRHKGQLGTFTKLDGSVRYPTLTAKGFAEFYPFLPYQIDLIIDVISGLRLQSGGSTHTGGSSRTIIKLAQQVIIDEKVGLGGLEVGPLVTLDRIYDLISQYVTPERRRDIEQIERNFPAAEYRLVAKVAKAILLLEQVKNLKRNPATLAAVLHPSVDSSTLVSEVEAALNTLKENQWVEEGENGWQILSPLGKQWAIERRNLAEPKPYQYTRYVKERLEEILKGKDFRYMNHRVFRPDFRVSGESVVSGDVPVNLILAEPDDYERLRTETAERSRESQEIFYVLPLSTELYRDLEEYHRSVEMIGRHKREARDRGMEVQLANEDRRMTGHRVDATNRLTAALLAGDTYFNGLRREAAGLGENLDQVIHQLFAQVIPVLYPKFQAAAVKIKDAEIARIIEDKTLNALPEVYFQGSGRLGIVTKEGGQAKPDLEAEVMVEVMNFIERNHRPPEKVTGKMLLDYFGGLGYGWDQEPIRMITATLLRAGKLEVMASGQLIQSHGDVGAREIFATLPAFRSASFAPKADNLEWTEVIQAAVEVGALLGEVVEYEPAAVSEGIRRLRSQEKRQVDAVLANIYRLNVPGEKVLNEHLSLLDNLMKATTDNRIRVFLGALETIKQSHELTVKLTSVFTNQNIADITDARSTLHTVQSAFAGRDEADTYAETVERLHQNLRSARWYELLPEIKTDRAALAKAYLDLYERAWTDRMDAYRAAIDAVKGYAKFTQLDEVQQRNVLFALNQRAQEPEKWSDRKLPTAPSIGELEAHKPVATDLKKKAILDIERLTAPEIKIERVKVARFVSSAIESEDALNEALEQLRNECTKLLKTGAKVILE